MEKTVTFQALIGRSSINDRKNSDEKKLLSGFWENYFDEFKTLKNIPYEHISEDMCIKMLDDAEAIPINKWNRELLSLLINKNVNSKVLTAEILEKFNLTEVFEEKKHLLTLNYPQKKIHETPKEKRNEEFYLKMYMENLSMFSEAKKIGIPLSDRSMMYLSDIPVEYRTKEIIEATISERGFGHVEMLMELN